MSGWNPLEKKQITNSRRKSAKRIGRKDATGNSVEEGDFPAFYSEVNWGCAVLSIRRNYIPLSIYCYRNSRSAEGSFRNEETLSAYSKFTVVEVYKLLDRNLNVSTFDAKVYWHTSHHTVLI